MIELSDTMTVDSFSFLWRDISKDIDRLEFYRNVLAIVGALYIGSKAVQLLYSVIQGVATHGIARHIPVQLEKGGRWAAVTGPTEGIGRAFAIELAKRGMSILLIGRNIERLIDISDYIENRYNCETRTVVIDFNDPGNGYEAINDAFKTLEIGVVVNNAGVINSYPSYIHEMDDNDITTMMNVNILAVTRITKIAVTHMRSRGSKGLIINLSSISSIAPAPLLQVYAASKAYVTSFSRAVHEEVKDDGITVQTLIPSYIRTRMIGYSPYLRASVFVPTPEVFVEKALGTVRYSTYTTGYWLHEIQAAIASSLPVSWYMYLVRRANMLFRNEYLANY